MNQDLLILLVIPGIVWCIAFTLLCLLDRYSGVYKLHPVKWFLNGFFAFFIAACTALITLIVCYPDCNQ